MALLGSVTRRQSIVIAIVMLVCFFAGGIYLVKRQSAKYQLAATTTDLPPPGIVEKPTPGFPGVVTTPGQNGESSGFLLNEFHRSQIKDGRTVWEVKGSRGQYFPAENKAVVTDARLILSRTEQEHVTVAAGEATLYLQGTELVRADIVRDVVLNYRDEILLTTDHALFDQTTNTVVAPGVVNINHRVVEIAGEDMVANLTTQEFNLRQKVVTIVKPRSKQ